MKFDEIIKSGLEAGKSYDEINAELKATGATFHLEEERTGKGWTEREMSEGFIAPTEEAKPVPERPVMARRVDLAGKRIIQTTKAGRYEVFYDIDGYAEKAIKVK